MAIECLKLGEEGGAKNIAAILSHIKNQCNVTIDCHDLQLGKEIAKAIRATTTGGLAGMQSMVFEHEGRVKIACNVEASKVCFFFTLESL